jgi:hypothetical protein
MVTSPSTTHHGPTDTPAAITAVGWMREVGWWDIVGRRYWVGGRRKTFDRNRIWQTFVAITSYPLPLTWI